MAEEQNDKPVAKDTASAASEGEGIVATGQPEAVEPRGWVSDWLDDWPWPGGLGRRFAEPWFRRPSGVESIRVEQYQDGNELVVRAELPGVDPDEDIDVSVAGDRLTISAQRQQREESKGDEAFRSEFHYGSFQRVMRLPAGTSPEDVKASYHDGILEVRLPTEAAEASKTKVRVERKS